MGYWKRKYHCWPLCGILSISTVCNISKPSINCSFFSLSLKKFRSEDGKYFFALGQGLAKSSVCAKSLQLCPTLCNMECSPPGSSVHDILRARILEWVAISNSMGSSWPRDWSHVSWVSWIAGRFFTTEPCILCWYFIFVYFIHLGAGS